MDYQEKIIKIKKLIKESDFILIGAGLGLSIAGGIGVSGEVFKKYFSDFIEKYDFHDMYSAGYYPFSTREEKWAYWSKYIYVNRYLSGPNKTYMKLLDIVGAKNYFVITTNVDHQFQLAGFDKNRLFYTNGDYGLFQCSVPCHEKTYDNENQIKTMLKNQSNCTIGENFIPKCPVCGEDMEVNLRFDSKFVEDYGWHRHLELYNEFLEKARGKKILLLEIGVGLNNPETIRFPFEKITYEEKNATLVRINKDYAVCGDLIKDKTICLSEDINKIFNDLK